MGTSILATLCHIHGVPVAPWVLLAVAVCVLVVIVAGWLRHRTPGWDSAAMGPWGMFSMGVLALGSAAAEVTGAQSWQVLSWWIGAPLGWVVCLNQLRRFEGSPTFQWGLALVAPMVAATSAGQLGYHWAGVASFLLAICTALPVFGYCYVSLLRGRMNIPDGLAGTAWIPLGVVGQSTAAAHVLFDERASLIYGVTILAIGVLPFIYASQRFLRGVAAWADYTPGWWGSTFPVGTLCLGTHLLSELDGWGWMNAISQVLLAVLAVHWVLCVVRFSAWALSRRQGSLS